ncbi:DNA translocase FtsK [Fibrobacter sp.]|uniref:DNA translocase FtsK n=1 Tax=Fibrobacter sp. TaxID=35828 RepID=UPI0038904D4C
MATQKKKTGRKTTPAKTEQVENSEERSLGAMVVGYGLIALSAIALLSCISVVYVGSEKGIMTRFGDFLNFAFGKLPVIFIILSVMLWGLFITFQGLRKKLFRVALGLSIVGLDLCVLMSIPVHGKAGVSEDVFIMRGGIVGRFLDSNIVGPLCGDVLFIPVIVLSLVLVAVLFFCFGLRFGHFAALFRKIRGIKEKAPAGEVDGESDGEDSDETTTVRRGISMDGDTTIFQVPDAYRTKHKGVLKPFSARKNWMEAVDTTAAETPMVDRVVEGTLVEGSFGTVAEKPAPKPLGEDPEILRLEKELRENGTHMSALEIREIRNKIAEIRRAREEINWENERQGNLVVKGAVRGGESETTDEATVVAGAAPEEATVVAGSVEETQAATVAKTMADNVEPTQVGDTEPPAESDEDEEDFIPQVVSSDEVDQDPSYVPPSNIGTSSGGTTVTGSGVTGIPQPDPTVHYDEYKVPSVDEILDTHEPQPADYTVDELNAIGKMLEEKLENFKVKGKVVGCETGPVITRFEVEPGPGVKVSQFSALQDDLAMALKAVSIRILAPIPGKGAVGIEIPNRKMQTIFGRDIFESDAFKPSPEKIVMALGKDISGEPFAMDLAKAPHLMIAGQTGSGKSVCINALMASMLFSKTPDELRMILVDPKAVELKMYENIPHLLAPVITKPEVAIQALQWLCYEMDRRTEVLASAKVRNIGGFNAKFEAGELPEEVPEEDRGHRMAFIVVIIDEMADLMMVAGKEIEKNVSRLAAKARAVGIHLVLATQRPSVKVITGNIKANLPTRISFKVASNVDARTVMDHAGAEKLLGRGDMLYKAVNAPDPVRLHGAFLSDEEAEKLADACSNQNVCYPQLETFEVAEEGGEGEDGEENAAMSEKKDKLLFEVAKWAIECGNGLSTSAVQRHFSVGYSRAGKIVDQLFGLGLCARSTGNSKPRAMLIDMDQLMQLERSGTFR